MKENPIKNICCIGAGYVGGPTMAVIAFYCPELIINVVDKNEKRIDEWNSKDLSRLPIYEPGLDELIKQCRGKNLFFSAEISKSIAQADVIFISVNTPTKTKGVGAGFASDLKWIESCAREISLFSLGHTIVVEKSTLPVRTAETIKFILESSDEELNKNSKTYSIISNPEFLAEGSAINDLKNPDRVLIGGEDQISIKKISEIYTKWVDPSKIIATNLWSSELSKLVANAFLAQRISSINSVSAICEATGANINEVSRAIGTDHRIGREFLNSGPGFGGSCFRKDILNLIYLCKYYGLDQVADYWEQVILINDWQQKRISKIIVKNLFGNLSNKKLAVLGFAFKANTNDTRDSPSIKISKELLEEDAELFFYDPKVSKEQIINDIGKLNTGNYSICKSVLDAVKDVDAIIVLTEWEEFKQLDWQEIFKLMRKPAWIFDTRHFLNARKLKDIGFNFWKLGITKFS